MASEPTLEKRGSQQHGPSGICAFVRTSWGHYPMAELRGDRLLELALGSIGTEVGRRRFGRGYQGSRIGAATVSDCYTVQQSVEHDDLNVLCLGARVIGPELARTFTDTQFSCGERHVRRLTEVAEIEHAGIAAPDRARGKPAT